MLKYKRLCAEKKESVHDEVYSIIDDEKEEEVL